MLEKIYSVEDAEFRSYGRVIHGMDITEIVEAAKQIECPAEGSSYLPSIKEFEELAIFHAIEEAHYGTLPTQLGYCWGRNQVMNAMEYHSSNEINIAVTPLVLILGHTWDVEDMKVDSSMFKAFYVPQGCVLEIYATTLHFCPCQVSDSGFGCIVGLPKGTNVQIDGPVQTKPLFKQNKWVLAHEENTALIEKGIVPGITGENYIVRYESVQMDNRC